MIHEDRSRLDSFVFNFELYPTNLSSLPYPTYENDLAKSAQNFWLVKNQILFIVMKNMSKVIQLYSFCQKIQTLKPPGSLWKSEKYMYFLPV